MAIDRPDMRWDIANEGEAGAEALVAAEGRAQGERLIDPAAAARVSTGPSSRWPPLKGEGVGRAGS